jgi:hypothetical protein
MVSGRLRRYLVIPGQPEGLDPESITTIGEYEFRVRELCSRPGMTKYYVPRGLARLVGGAEVGSSGQGWR